MDTPPTIDGAELAREWGARISSLVAGVENRLILIIAESVSADKGAPRHAVDLLARAGVTRARLERELGNEWEKILDQVQKALDLAREAGQGMAEKEIHSVFHNSAPLLAPAINNAVSLVALDTLSSLTNLKPLILRDLDDVYRHLVQQAVSNTVFGAVTHRQAMSDALAQFAAKGITSFTDKSGRPWRIDSYAEMAVRTGTMNAYREGHAQHLAANGLDLVYVAGHGYTCPKCAPWEGKVLSLGKTPPGVHYLQHSTRPRVIPVTVAATVQQATDAGLFHPNCGHSLSAYFPGVSTLTTSGEAGNPATYEASQKQRALEREIRKAKRELAATLDPEAAALKRAEINAYRRDIRELLAEHPKLKRKPERERDAKPTAGKLPADTTHKPKPGKEPRNTAARADLSLFTPDKRTPELEAKTRRIAALKSDMSALQDAKGRWLPDQMLEDHEILFAERFERLGHRVRWIARPEYVAGAGRKASNDFIWLDNGSEVCELKNVSARYASIKERIRQAVLKAEKHDVRKDVFIIDLDKARLSEKLHKQLSRYNTNVKAANIRRMFILSDSGASLIEIVLDK